jgi:hypothetical protein
MKAIDAIRIALDLSDGDIRFIEGMRDEPLTQPTQVGGNHPLWILGHLTYTQDRSWRTEPGRALGTAIRLGKRADNGCERLPAFR